MIMNPVAYIDVSPAALASMADLACLEISSRTARSRESWSVIVKVSSTPDSLLLCLTRSFPGWKVSLYRSIDPLAKRILRNRRIDP